MLLLEAERMQAEISNQNDKFRIKRNHNIQAAVLIQRAFRSYQRRKKTGITTINLTEKHELEELLGSEPDFGLPIKPKRKLNLDESVGFKDQSHVRRRAEPLFL